MKKTILTLMAVLLISTSFVETRKLSAEEIETEDTVIVSEEQQSEDEEAISEDNNDEGINTIDTDKGNEILYAFVSDDGELSFFYDENSYEDGSRISFDTDDENEVTGTIYLIDGDEIPWESQDINNVEIYEELSLPENIEKWLADYKDLAGVQQDKTAVLELLSEAENNNRKISFDDDLIELAVGESVTIKANIDDDAYLDYGVRYSIVNNEGNISFDHQTNIIRALKATEYSPVTISAIIDEPSVIEKEESFIQAQEEYGRAVEETEKAKESYERYQEELAETNDELEKNENEYLIQYGLLQEYNDTYNEAKAYSEKLQDELNNLREELAEFERLNVKEDPSVYDIEIAELNSIIERENETYQKVIDQINEGSLGFFKSHDPSNYAENIFDKAFNDDHDDIGRYTKLGQKGDATSLENMEKAIDQIKIGNELRANDENNTENGKKPLMVTDAMMAVAQIQANGSVYTEYHTSWDSAVAENLAFGTYNPYNGWYTMEKDVYNYIKERGLDNMRAEFYELYPDGTEAEFKAWVEKETTKAIGYGNYGHYRTLVGLEGRDINTVTGFAINNEAGHSWRVTENQVFARYNANSRYPSVRGESYTVEEYETDFDNYYTDLIERKNASEEKLSDLQKQLEDAKTARQQALESDGPYTQQIIEKKEDIAKTEALLSEAETTEQECLNIYNKQAAKTAEALAAYEHSRDIVAQINEELEIAIDRYDEAVVNEKSAKEKADAAQESLKGFIAVCNIRVLQSISSISITPQIEINAGDGLDLNNHISISPEDASDKNLLYESSDPATVTVDEKGYIKGLKKGSAIVTVMVKSNTTVKASCMVTVRNDADEDAYGTILIEDRPDSIDKIPAGMWVAGIQDFTYDPAVRNYTQSFRVYDHNTLLISNIDYDVKYTNNTKVGTASVVITGKGNYSGKLTKTFAIKSRDLSNDSDLMIILDKNSFIYNGKDQKAKVTSVEYHGIKLNKAEYDISYNDRSSYSRPGVYYVYITFKGNYKGSVYAAYKIIYSNTGQKTVSSLSISGIKNLEYDGTEKYQTLTIKDGRQTLTEGLDYQLRYINNIDAGTAYVVIEGKGVYTGSVAKSFKINPAAINNSNTSIYGVPSSADYNGEAVCPLIRVSYGKRTLTADEDYEVSYRNNDKAGTASVSIKGIGNYKGSLNRTFKINKLELKDDMFDFDDTYPYEKGGTRPVADSGLILNKDYTLTYKNNSKLGDAVVTVKGKGNYQGTLVYNFRIEKQDISKLRVEAADKVYTGKANSWKSNVSILDGNGKKLSAGTDYEKEIEYLCKGKKLEKNDVLNVNDTVTVIVKGKGNYQGTVSSEYKIAAADISKASVRIKDQAYTGKEVHVAKEDITIRLGKDIIDDKDYEIISYSNNITKGTASLTIRGKNNYGGTKTVKFNIRQKSLGITICFRPDGATGNMNDQYLYKDDKLMKNAFKYEGKRFVGWSLKPYSDKADYSDKQTYIYDSRKAGITIILYAVWKDTPMSIN